MRLQSDAAAHSSECVIAQSTVRTRADDFINDPDGNLQSDRNWALRLRRKSDYQLRRRPHASGNLRTALQFSV